MSVLFADVRGYTTIAETLSSVEATVLLQRFYETASRALLAHEAVLGQMAGDEVMAFFVPGLAGEGYRKKAVAGARALLETIGYGTSEDVSMTVGVGICSGEQFLGNVGGGGFKDFTALGDVTNTAARFQSQAQGGEIVLCRMTYEAVADEYPGAEARSLQLKGKELPVQSFLIRLPRTA
jgi:adenylate cyclase